MNLLHTPANSENPAMSQAFVNESEIGEGTDLPELQLSEHPNYVTPHGLTQLRERLDQTRRRLAAIDPSAEGSVLEMGRAEREQRWLQSRVMSAIPVTAPAATDRVGFGATVDLVDEHDTPYRYRIVGEDEADPERGLVSWVSPLARALDGSRVGDSVTWKRPAGDVEVEVLAFEYPQGFPNRHIRAVPRRKVSD